MGDAITYGLVPAILLCVLFLHMRLRDRLARVTAERDALAAIVDRLPKTADGVPIVPGATYFQRRTPGWVCEMKRLVMSPPDANGYSSAHWATGAGSCIRADRLYSTREAAEAAREVLE